MDREKEVLDLLRYSNQKEKQLPSQVVLLTKTMLRTNYFGSTFLGILSITVLLAGYWIYSTLIMTENVPYYGDYDPEMAYFMNSLAIFKGQSYFYTDHPGTPIEILGTIVLGITYPLFTNLENFLQYYLQHPESFLDITHGLTTALSIGCAVFLFVVAQKSLQLSNKFVALSLAVMFYGLQSYSFATLTVWSHTAFNFPLGTLCLLALFNLAVNKGTISKKTTLSLGLAAGAMIAVMVNFLPWLVTILLFVLIFYRLQNISWKQVFFTSSIIASASVAGFFLSTLPAIHRMPTFFEFIQKLINHQLPYGNGPEGITTLPLLLNNLSTLPKTAPVLFIAILAAVCATLYLLYQQRNYIEKNPGRWALAISLIVQIFILVLFVLKHPGERFLLPLAATMPVLYLNIIKLSEFNKTSSRFTPNLFAICVTISIVSYAIISLHQKQINIIQTRSFEIEANLAIQEQAQRMGKKVDELLILWSNATYSYCPPRLHGDFYTSGVFVQEIDILCPNQASFFFRENWVLYQGEQRMIDTLPWDLLITRAEMLAGNPEWKIRGIVWEYSEDVVVLSRKGTK